MKIMCRWRAEMRQWSFTKNPEKALKDGVLFGLVLAFALTSAPPVFPQTEEPLQPAAAATPAQTADTGKATSEETPAQIEHATSAESPAAADLVVKTDPAERTNVAFTPNLGAGLEKYIFLDLRDINVVDVFKFLATQGSLNIVTSRNVQGRSTLLLRNVKIKDALDILVISNQLAYEIRNDIIYIMTEDEYALAHGKNFNDIKKVMIRKLKNAKPSYVLAALQAVQSGIGKIIIDEDTGTVVMIDTPQKLLQLGAVLDQVENNLEMKVIKLEFAKVEDVIAQLKPQIEGKGVGTVIGDARSNQIIISAYPDRMAEAVKLAKVLDKQTKGVLIETRILQLTLNPSFDFGVAWQKVFRDWNNNSIKSYYPFYSPSGESDIRTNVASALGQGNSRITVGNFDTDEVAARLTAVKGITDTKLLASPRVMILDRQEAKINIGDRIPYVVTTSTGTGNNISVSEDIRFIDVGIIMSVIPTINDNGFITMKIRPEISSQTGDLSTKSGNLIPKVNTTFVDSTVIVQDGISVVLGGLMRDEQNRANQGLPYLMDIPVLGNLFKSRHESIKKTEIVIIITPHIVTGDTDVLDQPIQIKGRSTGNSKTAEFQVSTLDIVQSQTADAAASRIDEKAAPSRSLMGSLANGLSKLSPIKRGK